MRKRVRGYFLSQTYGIEYAFEIWYKMNPAATAYKQAVQEWIYVLTLLKDVRI